MKFKSLLCDPVTRFKLGQPPNIYRAKNIMTKVNEWLSSTEIRQRLRISGCELMHRREAGLLQYKKVGNAYYYLLPTIDALSKDVADAKASSR